jgi:hypothetical protein
VSTLEERGAVAVAKESQRAARSIPQRARLSLEGVTSGEGGRCSFVKLPPSVDVATRIILKLPPGIASEIMDVFMAVVAAARAVVAS